MVIVFNYKIYFLNFSIHVKIYLTNQLTNLSIKIENRKEFDIVWDYKVVVVGVFLFCSLLTNNICTKLKDLVTFQSALFFSTDEFSFRCSIFI